MPDVDYHTAPAAHARYLPYSATAPNTTSGLAVTLNPDLAYDVMHHGRQGATAGVTDDVMVVVGSQTAGSDYQVGSGYTLLPNLGIITIGPGVKYVNIRTVNSSGRSVDVSFFARHPGMS